MNCYFSVFLNEAFPLLNVNMLSCLWEWCGALIYTECMQHALVVSGSNFLGGPMSVFLRHTQTGACCTQIAALCHSGYRVGRLLNPSGSSFCSTVQLKVDRLSGHSYLWPKNSIEIGCIATITTTLPFCFPRPWVSALVFHHECEMMHTANLQSSLHSIAR